jgi:hypothetical protein
LVGSRVLVVVVLMAAELVGPRVYSCCNCRNHVCLHDDVISKAFQVRSPLLVQGTILPPSLF